MSEDLRASFNRCGGELTINSGEKSGAVVKITIPDPVSEKKTGGIDHGSSFN